MPNFNITMNVTYRELTTMGRPQWNDQMRSELAQIMGKIIFYWCRGETELSQCVADSEEILRLDHHADGYELARELEEKGYSPDAILVGELAGITYKATQIEKAHIEKWVRDNKLKLGLEAGMGVHFIQSKSFLNGNVTQLYPDTFQYGVRTPNQCETQHYLVNAELITRITQ